MEEIFKQSFEFAEIKLYKNYSNIQAFKKDNRCEGSNIEIFDPFSGNDESDNKTKKISSEIDKYYCNINQICLYPKNNRKFFWTDMPSIFLERGLYEPVNLINVVNKEFFTNSRSSEWFETQKSNQIKRHFNNPFATISIYKFQRWIKREGDKITIKWFKMTKYRKVNCRYFTKDINSVTITFNLKNGNFTVINHEKTKKIKNTKFFTNSFSSLETAMHSIYNASNKYCGYGRFKTEYNKIFNNKDFIIAIKSILQFDEKCLNADITNETLTNEMVSDFNNNWIAKFNEIKKIKSPDDTLLSVKLLTHFYPTQKYLKRNNGKLIASALDRFHCKSNITIKLLHQYPRLFITNLIKLCALFGKDFAKYIGNIEDDFFRKPYPEWEDLPRKQSLLLLDNRYTISDIEKGNIVKIINDYTNRHIWYKPVGDNLVSLFYDHFNMIESAKLVYPNIELRARTYENFHIEHAHLSEITRNIRKGYKIECIFEQHIIDEIEKPIVCYAWDTPTTNDFHSQVFCSPTTNVFLPKLLRTSEEYDEEGSYMSHCVSGYINSDDSIIVSLRFGKERVTIEFDVKTHKPLQSRYFCNQIPPVYFNDAIGQLFDRIKSISFSIKPLQRKKTPILINGKPININDFDVVINERAIPLFNPF